LEIAATGRHNLLMIGPPGAGKSMLAGKFPGLLPPLSPREALDVTMLHSIAGQLATGGLVQSRPFRDPHHSASMAALVGGGARARPGPALGPRNVDAPIARVFRGRCWTGSTW
jgi:magnesium chelatase family protein